MSEKEGLSVFRAPPEIVRGLKKELIPEKREPVKEVVKPNPIKRADKPCLLQVKLNAKEKGLFKILCSLHGSDMSKTVKRFVNDYNTEHKAELREYL